MVSFCPSATERSRIRLAEKSARIATPGAASGSSWARQNEPRKSSSVDPRRDLVRRRCVDVAHAHFLRPQSDAHRRAVLEAVDARCRRARSCRSAARSGPATSASRNVMVPTKSATKAVVGLAVDLRRRPDLLDHALVHHHDAVGHRERFFLVVRHHDGGDAEPALQRLDLVAQAQPHARIERGERLVEQQQAGRGRERARERDALLLAAGELHRIFGCPARSGRPARAARRRAPRSRRGRRGG